ncbi:transposase family protein [Leptothoe sp. EHU-05/26/07-4]
MRMQYATLKNKPRTLRNLTGFNPSESEALLPSFGVAWEHFVSETFKREGRKRAYGAGRKAHLKQLDDKLLFILVYFRIYPTQEVHGYLFGMSQGQRMNGFIGLQGCLTRR